jgi:DNA-binding transcriptional LysR family regulator
MNERDQEPSLPTWRLLKVYQRVYELVTFRGLPSLKKIAETLKKEGTITTGRAKLWRDLIDLETKLGGELLIERTQGHGIVGITRKGQEVYHRVRDLLERARGLKEPAQVRKLIIGTSATVLIHLLPPAVATFRQEHRAIELDFPIVDPGQMEQHVEMNTVDFGIARDESIDDGDPPHRERIKAESPVTFVCHPSHRLAVSRLRRKPVNPTEDLAGETIITFPGPAVLRNLLLAARNSKVIQVVNGDAALAYVRMGLGVAAVGYIPELLDRLEHEQAIVCRPIAGAEHAAIKLAVYRPRKRTLPPEAEQFIRAIKQHLEEVFDPQRLPSHLKRRDRSHANNVSAKIAK